jgi:hypothetical protein
MSKFIEQLSEFNSKERFFLAGYALGNPTFDPSIAFRTDISRVLGLYLPELVFAAMDFHLDWLFAAAKLASNETTGSIHPIEKDCITATQEDIDFLIAFELEEVCHVILLEAKGVTGWTNLQMNSKAHRLGKIFGADGQRWAGVVPHFAIVSPRQPQRLASQQWPKWMAPNDNIPWIELAGTEGRQCVLRCDHAGAKAKKDEPWTHWKVARRSGKKSTKADIVERVTIETDLPM